MIEPKKEKCDVCDRKIALVKFGWQFGECERCGHTTCEECLPDSSSPSGSNCPHCGHFTGFRRKGKY
jgi:hypothetical protein